ncbi:hypothetical protein PENTCL1PPCAC_3231, partial [Pristionchus entomophagus]
RRSRNSTSDMDYQCDGCDLWLSPSTGHFRCMVCKDWDLCIKCMNNGICANHALVRLVDANTLLPTENDRTVKLGDLTNADVRFIAILGDKKK